VKKKINKPIFRVALSRAKKTMQASVVRQRYFFVFPVRSLSAPAKGTTRPARIMEPVVAAPRSQLEPARDVR